ncbi:MAG: hypothetical protein IJX12_01230 [Lachnospiraceae bacterium]|nr:hypothetical protein [Lachnospiraceae bacterium]
MSHNDRINNPIISNLTMSEEMKMNILENCKKGRRTRDKLFRYSKVLATCLAVFCICISGLGVHAAISAVDERLQNMSEEEKNDYMEMNILGADAEIYTRDFTDTEVERILVLQEEYKKGRFPAETIAIVETVADVGDDELAVVKEDGKVHLPKDEMTDEELLQLIDYDEKTRYTTDIVADEETTEADTIEISTTEANSIEVDEDNTVTSMDISETGDFSKEMVKKYFDVDIDDSWEFSVTQIEGELKDDKYPEYQVVYDVIFEKNGPVDEGYHLVICGDNSKLISINHSGYVTAPNNSLSSEDALARVPQGMATVVNYIESTLDLDADAVKIYSGFNSFMEQVQTDFCYFMVLDEAGNGYRIRWTVETDEITEIKFYSDINEENINNGSVNYTLME